MLQLCTARRSEDSKQDEVRPVSVEQEKIGGEVDDKMFSLQGPCGNRLF